MKRTRLLGGPGEPELTWQGRRNWDCLAKMNGKRDNHLQMRRRKNGREQTFLYVCCGYSVDNSREAVFRHWRNFLAIGIKQPGDSLPGVDEQAGEASVRGDTGRVDPAFRRMG